MVHYKNIANGIVEVKEEGQLPKIIDKSGMLEEKQTFFDGCLTEVTRTTWSNMLLIYTTT